MKHAPIPIRTAVAASVAALGLLAGHAGAQSMADVQKVAQARGLSTADLLAAAKTYTPSGMKDEFVIFSSGGHSG